MKDSEYWKKRFELLEQSQNKKGIQCYDEIERQYRQAQKQIEGQIASWYQRFANNNGVTMQEARRMLTCRELEELKWDVNQYIKYGKENAVNGMWVKQLENASARYHISRLESIKLQTQQSLEVMFGNQLDSIDSTMRDVYKSGYYRTAFEIQKGVGVGWDFATLDERTISKVINKPWAADGKNFSERVWGNRQKLVNELNTELTRNIILGQDPQKAIDAIARKMNVSKNNAGRLVMTEEAFFSSAAQKDCFNELDVEQFEIVATLDSITSEICREMDGKVFPMSQWEVGTTAPPFHVRCRTTTVPAFGDEFDNVGKRAARGEDGKTYYVPADMNYRDWHESFVEGDKSDLKEVESDDIIKRKPIAGVECGKTMTFEEANSGHVNPNYGTNPYYAINCQSCVPTFEARQRGYNVQALPNKKASMCEKLSRNTNLVWIDPETGEHPHYIFDHNAKSPKKYLDFIQNTVTQGERYSIEFGWSGRSRSGHIVNLDRTEEGLLRIKDNQRGLDEVSEWIGDAEVLRYLSRMRYKDLRIDKHIKNCERLGIEYHLEKITPVPKLLRIDNMEFDFSVADEIMEGVKEA